jgi:hypothetical protein
MESNEKLTIFHSLKQRRFLSLVFHLFLICKASRWSLKVGINQSFTAMIGSVRDARPPNLIFLWRAKIDDARDGIENFVPFFLPSRAAFLCFCPS